MSKNSLTLQLNIDQEVTPNSELSQRILEISVLTPENAAAARPELNLALVLDRSGSMSGDKLAFVKQAAAHAVGLLQETDRAALVVYDDRVDTLFPSVPLTPANRSRILAQIPLIQTRGSTNLGLAWMTGSQEVSTSQSKGTTNRVLLLTDGLANQGITDPFDLGHHTREMSERGVSTSTFGVGADFNHLLLEYMATQGGGRFYFIESPADIPGIFESELAEMCTLFAREVEVTLTYPAALQVEVPGSWRTNHPEPGKLRFSLGSLIAGRSLQVYVKLSIPAGLAEPELLLKASLMAWDFEGQVLEASAQQGIRRVSSQEAAQAVQNDQVLDRFARVDLAHQASEALKLEEKGQHRAAQRMISDSLERHRRRIDSDLAGDYEVMADRVSRGMDNLERKRSHYDTYSQKQRREEMRPFRLERNPAGRILFEADGQLALLATGSRVCIGDRNTWHFMGRHIMPDRSAFLHGLDLSALYPDTRRPVNLILGMDVLHRLFFQIDARARELRFDNEYAPTFPIQVPLTFEDRRPVAEFCIAGHSLSMVIDTSARLTYLPEPILYSLKQVGVEWDAFPGLGRFETRLYQAELEIAGVTVPLLCGSLPADGSAHLLPPGANGILGAELYKFFRASFAMPLGRMSLALQTD